MKPLILFFFILFASPLIRTGARLLRLYLRVKKWKRVYAEVIMKKIEQDNPRLLRRRKYSVRAVYSYVNNGQLVTGDMVQLKELINRRACSVYSSAQGLLNRIQDDIRVYVNPDKPSESVMFCGGLFRYVLLLVTGFALLLTGIACCFLFTG